MPLHESLHGTVFASHRYNTWLAALCGVLTARPPHHYVYYHFAHHKHTGDRNNDPELSNSWLDPDIKTMRGYMIYLSGIPFWVSRTLLIGRHALLGSSDEPYLKDKRALDKVVREARMFVGLYVTLALISYITSSTVLWRYWVLPSLFGQPFLRYYLLAEHTGCEWNPNDMAANTRTTVTLPFYAQLAWQMPYHAEHHAWPSVPFYRLSALHDAIKQRSVTHSKCTPSGASGYSGVHAGIVASIKEAATHNNDKHK